MFSVPENVLPKILITSFRLLIYSDFAMGRPRKNDSDRRIAQLNLHLTKDEEATIIKYSAASGMFPPDWVRKKIFTGKFPAIKISPIEVSLYQELKRIGVNLNQGTHKLNQGDFPAHYRELQAELLRTLDTIYKVLVDEGNSDQKS